MILLAGMLVSSPLGGVLSPLSRPALAQEAWAKEWQAGSPTVGQPRIAVDGEGRPHIVSIEPRSVGAAQALVHAFADETGWHLETIHRFTALGAVVADVAVDGAGDLHVCFTNASSKVLHYAFRSTAGSWTVFEITDAGIAGSDLAMAIDRQGRPHIVCYDPDNTVLKHLRREGETWLCEVIDPGPGSGRHCALTIGTSGDLHVSYQYGYGEGPEGEEYAGSHLRYAYRDAAGWHTSTVARGSANQLAAVHTAIALAPKGGPHIAYGVAAPVDGGEATAGGAAVAAATDGAASIHHAYLDGTEWRTEAVAAGSVPSLGQAPQAAGPLSIEVAADGAVHVAFAATGTGRGPVPVHAVRSTPDGAWTLNPATTAGAQAETLPAGGVDLALDPRGLAYLTYVEPSATGIARAVCARVANPQAIPAVPAGFRAQLVGSCNARLTWSAGTEEEDGFVVRRRESAAGDWEVIALLPPGTTAHLDPGLAPGSYSYQVKACRSGASNAFGGSGPGSEWSATADLTIPPAVLPQAPAGLTATAVPPDAVDLVWTDTSSGESGFAVERTAAGGAWQEVTRTGPDVHSFVDAGLALGPYSYRVRAYRDFLGQISYSAYSSEVSVNVRETAEPEAPAGLWITVLSSSRVRLDWEDMSDGEKGFRIERRKAGVEWTQVGSAKANAVTYTNSGLTSGYTYTYRVRAYKTSSGTTLHSAYSNEVSVMPVTITAPAAPSRLTAVAAGVQVRLSWVDTSSNEKGFRVERRTGSGNWQTVATLGEGKTEWQDPSPVVNQVYSYRVRSFRKSSDVNHYSVPSNEVTVRVEMPPVPAMPSGLTAVALSPAEVQLTWSDNSEGESGFLVERSIGNDSWLVIATAGADTTVYYDHKASMQTVHRYRVRAFNLLGTEMFTSQATEPADVMAEADGYLDRPEGLTATPGAPGRIRLAWTDRSDGETSFVVERRTPSGGFAVVASVAAQTVTYDDTGLEPRIQYTYRVRALLEGSDTCAYSAYSDPVVATAASFESPGSAPGGLAAEPVSEEEIRVEWTGGGTGALGYVVERNRDWGGFTPVATVAAGLTAFVDRNVEAGRTYIYRVRAYGNHGYSGYSPTRLTATPGTAVTKTTVVKLRIGEQAYSVDGVPSILDAAPIIVEGRTLLPIRAIIESLGGAIAWDEVQRKVTMTLGTRTVQVWIDVNEGLVNGVPRPIDAANPAVKPLIVPPGRTMLPIRFVTENLGCQVDWDGVVREVTILRAKP